MLFKRKGGNQSRKAKRVGRSDTSSVRQDEEAARQQAQPDAGANEWDVEARQEMASLFDKAKKNEALEGTRRAIAQRRAEKKMGAVDWDIAAREEITALFGAKDDAASSKDTDNDLEAVRRAIAERKQQAASSSNTGHSQPSVDGRVTGRNVAPSDAPDEEQGPRLDWLVDFISDDDKSDSISSDRNAINGRVLPVNNDSGVGYNEIEIVPGAQPGQEAGPPSSVRGDGFGKLQGAENTPSAQVSGDRDITSPSEAAHNGRGDALNSGLGQSPSMERKADVAGRSDAAGRSAPPKRPVAEQPGRNLPQSRRSMELEALRSKDRVVSILLKRQLVTMSQVYEAQKIKEREDLKETLWRILVDMNGVNRDAIFEEAARIYAFPVADTDGKLDAKFVRSVMETLSPENRELLLNLHLVPFECEADQQSGNVKLVFITHDPMRTEVRKVMKELKLDRFDLYYAPKAAVDTLIAEAFPRKNEYLDRLNDDPMAFDLGMSYEEAELIDEDALEAEISRSTLINLFEATLVEAVRVGASDVHIYPNDKKRVEIHFRVDGRLTLWHTEHKVHPEALLAVIKDNAMNVDRFERDAAQDGYIQRWIDDVLIRFRVSVLPIANASQEIRSESIVIRVLDDRKVIRDLRKLGLLEEAMHRFEQAIKQPHGMVILTGPTGSGKSTSLVAALHHVISGEVNVLTVEDPVEYIIPGVRQIKLNYKLELENALRAILRHDPDIVMVGEMRDRKTAELAIKLANTGHLTFSTLHTNDAPSAISRLYKMGIEPFLIAYAINLIVAQRLIRELCPTCKQEDTDPDPVMLEQLGFTQDDIANLPFYIPGNDDGCPTCKGVGYKGRRAICEALYFSREIRHMIVEADKMIDEGSIKEQAEKEGMLSLRDSAREIVKMGLTSVREMVRVVTSDI